ncbi:MAG: hypothetical protein KF760_13685 [Candidatus Eremiobacteraeota bacterium]|nr:hypothetical protein [Candidatus Eremiobacteraeota bacterium]MCW5867780.1 hypothetical protein [Candidatus Eremiobacteraeota bacterium]
MTSPIAAPIFRALPPMPRMRAPIGTDQVQLGQDERHELDQWKQRYQPQLGLLQTPPLGPIDPQVNQARLYVEQLVQDLAGDDLKQQGVQLRVELFSGDQPQAGVDDLDAQEKQWESQHPGQPWPIRSWLNAPKEGQRPLYRLVLSEGLLRNLETREELGFVVAHELSRLLRHDLQDPDNQQGMRVKTRSWLDSREMQAGQDAAALAMLTRARLNPEGALGALNKLYSKFPLSYVPRADVPGGADAPAINDDQKTALAAAAHGQEHEGVRLALLQAQIEQMRRNGEPATLQPSTPLPAALVPETPAEYDVHVADFARFQQNFIQTAHALTGDTTPEWMFQNKPTPEVMELRLAKACPQDFEKALVGLSENLAQADLTPQQRVNGFLRTLLAVGNNGLPPGFSQEGCGQIQEFLKKNGAFEARPFCDSLSQGSQSLHREFATSVQLNPSFQKMLGGQLAGLSMEAAPNYARDPKTGQSDVTMVTSFLKSPWAGPLYPSALGFLARQDPEQLSQQNHQSGLPLGLVLCNQLRSLDQLPADFSLQLRGAMAPIQEAANHLREDHARLRLRPPLAEPAQLNAYLQGLFRSEQGGSFSPEFEQQLPALLKDLVLTCNQQKDLVFDSSRPLDMENGQERRLCSLLGSAQPAEKREIARYLSRQWAHELHLPSHSARRQWTPELNKYYASLTPEQLQAELTTQDLSQHSDRLRSMLSQTYRLKPEEVADLSTANLKALDKRREAGEFTPRPDQFSQPADYAQALKTYQERCAQIKLDSRFLSAAESRPILSQLAMIGQDRENSQKLAAQLTPQAFESVLAAAEAAVDRSKTLRHLCNDPAVEALGSDAGAFLMDGFLANEKQIPELDRFWDLAQRTSKLSPAAIEARPGTRDRFARSLFPRLEKLPVDELRGWLGKEHVLQALKPGQVADLLMQVLGDDAQEGADVHKLAQKVAGLDQELKLQEKFPLAYSIMRDDVALQAKLQPSNVNRVFPPDNRNPVEQISVFRHQAAALSGIVAMTRNHAPEDQLATIEYLMGRQADMPPFLEAAAENQNLGPLAQALRNARQELSEADPLARVMVANSFLAGPGGLLHMEGGKEALMAKLMKGVQPKFLALAGVMTQAILSSQGDTDSLAVAFVLGQKTKGENLSAADILNRVFDSYGVPGIKMKQYLAFTSEFADFREAFESAQDAAMPLTYYQIVKLIDKRFGKAWPEDLKVDKVLGSGSVNLAIRYTDARTGKREVVSLGREAIEESTNYDFARFQKFTEALTTTPENKEKFGYIGGLSKLIQDSVKLEFDKESALAVQKLAFQSYKHHYNGWTVRSIDAYKVQHLGLFMEEARGQTARKILDQNPDLYREALRPMAHAEMSLIKGQLASGNLVPVPMFANPDFHDGQVLVDEPNKTVTMLDFGQAVPITNEERELALDLMTVLGKLDTPRQAIKRLNRKFFPNSEKGLSLDDLKPVMTRPKVMDKFIHLLSLLARNGADVPISTVHWVLAMNRQLVLGEKLDQSIKGQLVGMVVNHKLGLPLGVFNTVYAANEKVKDLATGLLRWALPKHEENKNLFKSVPQEEERRWHQPDGFGWYPFDPEE